MPKELTRFISNIRRSTAFLIPSKLQHEYKLSDFQFKHRSHKLCVPKNLKNDLSLSFDEPTENG